MRMALIGFCTVLASCTLAPSVVKSRTMMTPTDIAAAGLVCRTQAPIGSNLPKSICASESAWAAYDRRARLASEELFSKGRETSNVGRFNRD